MKSFTLFENGTIAEILCEPTMLPGVARIAKAVADDMFLVTGREAIMHPHPGACFGSKVVIFATAGHSAWVDSFVSRGLAGLEGIDGKRECYLMTLVETPFTDYPEIEQALLIVGSDKIGTIYGMFRLSELCGVSPLVFWGDAAPEKRESIKLAFTGDIVSKEPSVRYRGFFINDEWPAFGKWCTERYGGFNVGTYDKVFQLLLRLKGNYLWPAMWDSSFSEDGPGLENARLANDYGIIMGTSHHEPMCRAGVEWQWQYYKYGTDNTWSFVTNSKAITDFWRDGILRNKDFENVITIGMRGESDSLLLGEDATVQDNINVLKSAIAVQNQLIRDYINPNLKDVPRMFAIYKEVEDFFFGIGGRNGLCGWDELEDVILLFSDDNHGCLRAIPKLTEKRHSGGYGIYYHFDYHGGPYSFEWLGHTKLAKAWEQLTMAYEYGIRDMWIANVGDIKGNEFPLSFFMDLAFDYEKWGITNPNSASEYTSRWIDVQFGQSLNAEHKRQIYDILDAYTTWSSARIPESLNPDVFKNDFHEIETMYRIVDGILHKTDMLRNALIPERCSAGFESMVYFPVMAFFTAMRVNLLAGLNHLHAKRAALVANQYAAELQSAIPKDRFYVNMFHNFLSGKWNHMMESAHMCFRTWCDNDWAYPVVKSVLPIPYPKTVVSFRGFDVFNLGYYWQDAAPICNTELTRPDVNDIIIDIDSRGDVDYNYKISCDKPWLTFSKTFGKSLLKENPRISITAHCDRNILDGDDTAAVTIDFVFKDETKKQAFLDVKASNKTFPEYPGAFLEASGYLCINAEHFSEISDVDNMGWRIVPQLGRTGNALKSFPVTKSWETKKERPYVRYDFVVRDAQEYVIAFYYCPRNPMTKGGMMKGCYSINDGGQKLFNIVGGQDYATNETDADWSYGATNSIRKVCIAASLNAGHNSLKYYATGPNVILETIVIYPARGNFPELHLAPPQSYRIPQM